VALTECVLCFAKNRPPRECGGWSAEKKVRGKERAAFRVGDGGNGQATGAGVTFVGGLCEVLGEEDMGLQRSAEKGIRKAPAVHGVHGAASGATNDENRTPALLLAR